MVDSISPTTDGRETPSLSPDLDSKDSLDNNTELESRVRLVLS